MRHIPVLLLGMMVMGCAGDTPRVEQPAVLKEKGAQPLETVATFYGPMPTGVAVSKSGRIFVNFPRWGDPVEFTVAEIRNGKAEPFPNLEMNKLNTSEPDKSFVSVQSVVVDDQDRLWILDTGSINFQPVISGGAKLVCVDLATNQIVKNFNFRDQPAVPPTTYLNDIRFDTRRNRGFITDSSDSGPNGIIVVDLESGQAFRRLHDHPSTHAEANFVPMVEGKPLMARPAKGPAAYLKIGSDGIAITPDGKTLHYCPLAGRHLYSVSVDAMVDRAKGEDEVAMTVKDLGDRGFASDGLDCDASGTLYLTDYENNAIRRLETSGAYSIVVQDTRMIWPDSIDANNSDGYAYFICNQLNRQPRFHHGQEMRREPYALFRVQIRHETERLARAGKP